MIRPVRAGGWLGGLVAAGTVLRLAATGDLAPPPLTSPAGWVDWVDAREPVGAAVALVRLVAELGVWYVLAVSALHVAARVLRVGGAHRLADALATPAVSRLVRTGLGVGVVAASTLSPSDAAPPARGTATMAPLPGAATAVLAPSSGTATMRPLADPPRLAEPAAPTPPTTWSVAAGESLWSIAEEVLFDARGRPPTDAEVDPFWRSLVERNRARLADPTDPDLIHPGLVLELPPVP
ncbi:MAG TPA: hypothetical protein VFV42_07255 [Acidimicrobiales bacterium]|nr:hypothetical protein [Acidimicrobiales bacterium]